MPSLARTAALRCCWNVHTYQTWRSLWYGHFKIWPLLVNFDEELTSYLFRSNLSALINIKTICNDLDNGNLIRYIYTNDPTGPIIVRYLSVLQRIGIISWYCRSYNKSLVRIRKGAWKSRPVEEEECEGDVLGFATCYSRETSSMYPKRNLVTYNETRRRFIKGTDQLRN